MVAVREPLEQVSSILFDKTNRHYKSDELYGWFNRGQAFIVNVKPEANAREQSHKLVNGTRQKIPDDALELINVPRNLGIYGSQPGPAITKVDQGYFSQAVPGWHTHEPSEVIEHFMFDHRDKRAFHVYPAARSTYVELVCSFRPPTIAGLDDPISIGDEYINPLIDYVLARAFSKTSKRYAPQKAQYHQGLYMSALGLKQQAERYANPRTAKVTDDDRSE